MKFKLKATYIPAGDQPEAIEKLGRKIEQGVENQVLLGVTGSGKTFTLAKVIEQAKRPVLVISHNKTLAAQLYQEFRDFFPGNAVSYFVSYYDYYQPEAYIPQTDTYIEKETSINDEIDKLRLAATTNLLTRPDVIVVASVSAIYSLGSPRDYAMNIMELIAGEVISREAVIKRLIDLQYERINGPLLRGKFRVRGENIEVWPADRDHVLRIIFDQQGIRDLVWMDHLEMEPIEMGAEEILSKRALISPVKHFLGNSGDQKQSVAQIRKDLAVRLEDFKKMGKLLEAQRLEQRVNYDLEMIESMGYVNGIENYSRYFDGREPGEAPFTMLDYMSENVKKFNKDGFLMIIDESHMTLPQIRGMYQGDLSRKGVLIEHGFRLPSALDNRPLRYEEFARRIDQTIYVSATPANWELGLAGSEVTELLVRPTGLLEPEIEIKPIEGQIKDLVREILLRKKKGERVLVTTLTKKMAEELAEYLQDQEWVKERVEKELVQPIKVHYLHADVKTLDRIDVLDDLRLGEVDVVVGINLLREGLDLPEVSLVAILDADKEGFLRSETSLIQTMGRASRHVNGKVILYADKMTQSMDRAIKEIERRREIQKKFNEENGITPQTIVKPVRQKLLNRKKEEMKPRGIAELASFGWSGPEEIEVEALTPSDRVKLTKIFKKKMNEAAKNWEFEKAASYRDLVEKLS